MNGFLWVYDMRMYRNFLRVKKEGIAIHIFTPFTVINIAHMFKHVNP